jgi:hypothetical protein
MDTPYKLELEDCGTYLYAHLTGQGDFQASLQYWSRIADKAVELGHRKVLVHENMLGTLSKAQVFEVVTRIMKPEYLSIHVAFFDENLDNESLNALGQLVASNRGATVELFHSLEAARTWIKQDD